MRMTLLALAMVPGTTFAQETTVPAPAEPLAQAQSCPVGMVWDQGAGACAISDHSSTPMDSLSDRAGCAYSGNREIMS